MKLRYILLALLPICILAFFTCNDENHRASLGNENDIVFEMDTVVDQVLTIYGKSPRNRDLQPGKSMYIFATAGGLSPNEIYWIAQGDADSCEGWYLKYVLAGNGKTGIASQHPIYMEDGMLFYLSAIDSMHGRRPKSKCNSIFEHCITRIMDFPIGEGAPPSYLLDEKLCYLFAMTGEKHRWIKIDRHELDSESHIILKELILETIRNRRAW